LCSLLIVQRGYSMQEHTLHFHHHPVTTHFPRSRCFFFFHDPPTTEIYTLSLHDALPIWMGFSLPPTSLRRNFSISMDSPNMRTRSEEHTSDSSHVKISYAVFCLKKKKKLTCQFV